MTDRIIVLDGHALNPGDLDWSPFTGLGSLELHERTAEADVVARAGGASCVLLNKTPMSRATLARLPALRYIGVLATGYNVVDLQAAHRVAVHGPHIGAWIGVGRLHPRCRQQALRARGDHAVLEAAVGQQLRGEQGGERCQAEGGDQVAVHGGNLWGRGV